jgi:hypothetical protein
MIAVCGETFGTWDGAVVSLDADGLCGVPVELLDDGVDPPPNAALPAVVDEQPATARTAIAAIPVLRNLDIMD